jgi:cell division protein FtsX
MDDTTPRVRTLMRGITGAFTGISLEYTSREEALSLLALRNPDLASLASAWDENPLPASLRLRSIPLDSYMGLNTYISSFQDVLEYNEEDIRKKIVDYRAQYTRVEAVVHNLRLLEYGVYILLALFAFTVFVVVHTVIRNFIFYLRDEIEIIELVWWKTSFIYLPFLLQALFYTLVATFLAFGSTLFLIELFLQTDILPVFTNVFEWFQIFFWVVGTSSILVFILLTILSSFLATFKYIHGTIRTR